MRRALLCLAMILVAVMTLAACSANVAGNSVATTPTRQATTTAPPPTSALPPTTLAVATVGSTVRAEDGNGAIAYVTLVQITDPATGADEFTTPDPGKRFVAATIKIMNAGVAALNDDANSDLTLIGSDDQDYTATFDQVAGCTNFNGGSYTIAVGDALTGCVTFELPAAVTPAKAQFALTGFGAGKTAQWTIGPPT